MTIKSRLVLYVASIILCAGTHYGAAGQGTVSLVDSVRVVAVDADGDGFALSVTERYLAGGRVRRSIDNGLTWQDAELDSSKTALSVSICSDGTAYLGLVDGLMKSTDRGASWSHAWGGSPYPEIYCMPNGDLLLGGWSSGLYALRDDLTRLDSITTTQFSPDHDWKIGRATNDVVLVGLTAGQENSMGAAYSSNDGGLSFVVDSVWTRMTSVAAAAQTATGFTYYAGYHDVLYYDVVTGEPRYGGTPFIATRVIPVGQDSLIAAAREGTFVSADAGRTWGQVGDPGSVVRNSSADDIAKGSGRVVLVATFDGMIRLTGDIATNVDIDSVERPDSVALDSYPNPASSLITLRVTGDTCQPNVRLVDVLGRVVSTLADAVPANEWVQLQIPSVSNGNYFIQSCCLSTCASKSVSIRHDD